MRAYMVSYYKPFSDFDLGNRRRMSQHVQDNMDQGKLESMREQQRLQQQMEYAYKAGNVDEVERIKRKLDPDA